MGWTKRDLVNAAFDELAIAGYEFDRSPEEDDAALRRLDAMQATWVGQGIRIGYALPSSPSDSDLDQESGLPDYAVETTFLNLAIRMAPGNGKQLSPETRRNASDGYDVLMADAARPRRQQYSGTLPVGAGNRTWPQRGPFYPAPTNNPLEVAQGGGLDIAEE